MTSRETQLHLEWKISNYRVVAYGGKEAFFEFIQLDLLGSSRVFRSALGETPASLKAQIQHSIMFTAKPPRAVSLYLVIMSAPVSRIVLMTLSSETLCVPSPRSAM